MAFCIREQSFPWRNLHIYRLWLNFSAFKKRKNSETNRIQDSQNSPLPMIETQERLAVEVFKDWINLYNCLLTCRTYSSYIFNNKWFASRKFCFRIVSKNWDFEQKLIHIPIFHEYSHYSLARYSTGENVLIH